MNKVRTIFVDGVEIQTSLTAVEIASLQQENQELKNQIETLEKVNKQLICKLDRYDAIVDERDELKKQLEEYIKQNMKLKNELFDKRKEYQDTYKDVRIEIKEYKTQQKEFIKWLEDYINLFDKKDIYEEGSCDMLEEILQKYRSIIGDDR